MENFPHITLMQWKTFPHMTQGTPVSWKTGEGHGGFHRHFPLIATLHRKTWNKGFHLPLISALVMKVKGGMGKISGTFPTCRHIMRSDMMKSGKILRTFSAYCHIGQDNMGKMADFFHILMRISILTRKTENWDPDFPLSNHSSISLSGSELLRPFPEQSRK